MTKTVRRAYIVGDKVRPIRQWRRSPNNIPSGRVRKVVRWGNGQALYVGNDHRAFADYVFERSKSV